MKAWMWRVLGLVARGRRERELEAELASHVEMHVEELMAQGMDEKSARLEANRQLGGVEQTKEAWRERASVPWAEQGWQDLKQAGRQLRRSPGYASTAVVILMLGLAASVTLFTFADAALFRPLPYREVDRLVGVFETVPMFPLSNLSFPDYQDWKRMNRVFTEFDIYQGGAAVVRRGGALERVSTARVSAGFFRTLGVKPELGRDFMEGEDRSPQQRTALLSWAAWQEKYGGRADIVGQTVILSEKAHVIIGVMPKSFHFAPVGRVEFFQSMHAEGGCYDRRSCHSLYGVARLKDGVTYENALAEVKGIAKELERQYPDSNRGQGAALKPLAELAREEMRTVLLLLLGGAGLLWAIACLNVTSLVLVRAEGRQREMAVRGALGASRGRVARQYLVESAALTGLALVVGLAAAWGLIPVLISTIPEYRRQMMPFLEGLTLNARALWFAGGLSGLATLILTVAPMARRTGMRAGLAEGSRGSSGTAWRRVGAELVVVELATAVMLLAGAGLLGRSLERLMASELGFRPVGVATVRVVAPESRYPGEREQRALVARVRERVEQLGGVESVALCGQPPVTHNGNTTWIRIVGKPFHGEHNEMPERAVGAAYFRTLGARLKEGRYFEENEDETKPLVAIVNEAFVKQYLPGERVLGQRIANFDGNPPYREIVGVVEDVREGPPDQPVPPVYYTALAQAPERAFVVMARTGRDAGQVGAEMGRALRELDPEMVVSKAFSMEEQVALSPAMYQRRSAAAMAGGFAGLALLLSAVGLYGVISYSVSQRRREIGVRVALGARSGRVYGLILGEACRLILIGLGLGLAGALAGGRLLKELLYGTSPTEVGTLVGVAGVMGVVAVAAALGPAWRAARANPVEALRAE